MTTTVYLLQRDNFDGLYLFENEEDRDAYAEWFPDADIGVATVLDPAAAAKLLADERADCDHDDSRTEEKYVTVCQRCHAVDPDEGWRGGETGCEHPEDELDVAYLDVCACGAVYDEGWIEPEETLS